jgi:hypothetical protein
VYGYNLQPSGFFGKTVIIEKLGIEVNLPHSTGIWFLNSLYSSVLSTKAVLPLTKSVIIFFYDVNVIVILLVLCIHLTVIRGADSGPVRSLTFLYT